MSFPVAVIAAEPADGVHVLRMGTSQGHDYTQAGAGESPVQRSAYLGTHDLPHARCVPSDAVPVPEVPHSRCPLMVHRNGLFPAHGAPALRVSWHRLRHHPWICDVLVISLVAGGGMLLAWQGWKGRMAFFDLVPHLPLPCFYVWMVYWTGRWIRHQQARSFTAALVTWGSGMYVFLELAPA